MKFDESKYMEKCQHSPKFNRIFSILFFLLILSSVSFTFLPLIKINKEVIKHIAGLGISFACFSIPLFFALIFNFVCDMIEGNITSTKFGILLMALCLAYRNAFNVGTNFINPIVMNFDLIIFGIFMIIYTILDACYFNKLKGAALTVLQTIKYALIITGYMCIQLIMYKSATDDMKYTMAYMIGTLLISLFFIPVFINFLNYKKIIPTSGLAASIILVVIALSFVVTCVLAVLGFGQTKMEIYVEGVICIVVAVIHFIISLILLIVANNRISSIPDYEPKYNNNIFSNEIENKDEIEE